MKGELPAYGKSAVDRLPPSDYIYIRCYGPFGSVDEVVRGLVRSAGASPRVHPQPDHDGLRSRTVSVYSWTDTGRRGGNARTCRRGRRVARPLNAPITEGSAAVLAAVTQARIVPVLVVKNATAAGPLAAALSEGGLRLAEVTFRTAAAPEVLHAMAQAADFLVGAGTVLTGAQVDEAVAAGARFIVSPGFSAAVVRRCQELGVPVLPGVATATEIMAALDEGLDGCQVLPGRAARRADHGQGAGRAVPRRCGSSPPAASPRHCWPATWPSPPCSRSAAPGWSRPTCSRPATGPRSPGSPPRRSR